MARPQRYVIGVLRETESLGGSAYMHDKLAVGDTLKASPPSNDFPLYEAGEANILIAGGIGITPMMSMAARLAELGRATRSIIARARRTKRPSLPNSAPGIGDRLQTHFDGGDPARGLDVKTLLGTRLPGMHVYVCGPLGLIRATVTAAADWPKGTVHYELFKGSAADLASGTPYQPFDIVLKKAGKTFTVPADKSILDVLKAEGFKIKTLCTSGRCGTCRVNYLSGKVDHRDDSARRRRKADVSASVRLARHARRDVVLDLITITIQGDQP